MSGNTFKIYHYTKLENCLDIMDGHRYGRRTGLIPMTRIGSSYNKARETGAIFGLLTPQPVEWTNNRHFDNIWNRLVDEIRPLLLEIDIKPTDRVYVADRGHVEGVLYEDAHNTPVVYRHSSREVGEKAFMASMVPLDEYLAQKDKLSYSLPEVLILNPIPKERIKVSREQPLLEEDLEGTSAQKREQIVRTISDTPFLRDALRPWRTVYEKHHGPLEIRGRDKETK